MFLLLLKTEKNACTSLDFVGMYGSKADAVKYLTPKEAATLKESGYGNRRMLESADGLRTKDAWITDLFQGSAHLIVEY